MKKLAITLILVSLVFNFIETAYFGFNTKAMSRPEEVYDVISSMLFNAGFVFLIIWVFSKHTITIKEKE